MRHSHLSGATTCYSTSERVVLFRSRVSHHKNANGFNRVGRIQPTKLVHIDLSSYYYTCNILRILSYGIPVFSVEHLVRTTCNRLELMVIYGSIT